MTVNEIKDWYIIESNPEIADIYLNKSLCDDTLNGKEIPVSVVRDIKNIICFDNSKITGETDEQYIYYEYDKSIDKESTEVVRYLMLAFPTVEDLKRFYQIVDDELMMGYVYDNRIYRAFYDKKARTAMTAFYHLKKFHDMIMYKGLQSVSDTLIDRLMHDLDVVESHFHIISEQYNSSEVDYTGIVSFMKEVVPKMKHSERYMTVRELIGKE